MIGNGSNLLVSDQGYRGVILQIYRNMSQIRVEGNVLKAQAGALLSAIAARAYENSLTGFEFAAGIPGNDWRRQCNERRSLWRRDERRAPEGDGTFRRTGEIFDISKEEMELGYRTSIISKKGYITLEGGDRTYARKAGRDQSGDG